MLEYETNDDLLYSFLATKLFGVIAWEITPEFSSPMYGQEASLGEFAMLILIGLDV